jgi:hypothetical protein
MSGPQPEGRPPARSGDSAAPAALGAVAELLEGRTPTSRTFIAGLIAGALVGAVVAGGQLLRRRVGRA